MKENSYLHLLQHKSFMAFWTATTLMRLASNILQFALAIYVLDLTGSAFVYSTVLSVILIPRILCTSIAGVFADFADNIRILRRGTLGLTALIGCFLAVHVLMLPLNLPLIYTLVICLELCETFLAPSEGKALLCIVSEKEIAPASKLSSLDDGIVEILSPVIAALFYGWLGLTGVLCVMFILEGTALLLTARMKPCSDRISLQQEATKAEIFSLQNTVDAYREAVLCLKQYPYVMGIILFAPLFNFFINPLFSVTAPHYFRVTMQADVEMYALFNTVLGIAGLVAPFFAMAVINDKDEYRANKAGTVASAAVLLGLSFLLHFGKGTIPANKALYSMSGAMALLVAMITIMNIATSITIKKHIPQKIMGRVISIIQLCATVSVPLGQLFYGFCSDKFELTASFLISVFGLAVTFIVMVKTYRTLNTKQ